MVWALPFSLATTQGVEVSFLSSGYLDVSVRRLASACPMYSGRGTRALPRVGFPIRTSPGQRLVSTSPELFAAAHVLHRLSAPRHPPCALVLLIEKNTCVAAMEFSRCARTRAAVHEIAGARPVSQNSTAYERRGRRCSRRAGCPGRPKAIDRASAYRSKRAPDSLERR